MPAADLAKYDAIFEVAKVTLTSNRTRTRTRTLILILTLNCIPIQTRTRTRTRTRTLSKGPDVCGTLALTLILTLTP